MREAKAEQLATADYKADWALFLDFDGTLVDIVERPDAVTVHPELPGMLALLQKQLGGALAIISGRPIAFLDKRFDPFFFDIGGLHGLERRVGDQLILCQPEDHPQLRDMIERLKGAVAHKAGVLIEDKGCSVAVHWRLAPHEKDFVLATVQAAEEALGPAYRVQYGKAVAEILPSAAGKGKVIEQFLQQEPYRGRRPIFAGDDLTDENGFATINAHDGVSIRIGAGDTVARERLGTPADLRHSLSAWAAGAPLPFTWDR
jgi:trehalose 6-phosphate phosphatase